MKFGTKYCPACGAEYLPRAITCADCGSDLQWVPPEVPEHEGRDQEEGWDEDSILLYEAGDSWIRALADMLSGAGISSRIEVVTQIEESGERVPVNTANGFLCKLHVARADGETARRVLSRFETLQIPALEEQPYRSLDGQSCPACQTALPESCTECPECGLVFQNSGESCPGGQEDHCP